MITAEQVKSLRDQTGISVMQCKKALEEASGDMEKAILILRKRGAEVASKKADRTLTAGAIGSYIHSDKKLGVLVELLCETDFVAKNEEFVGLAQDLAMHIAAMNPEFLKNEDIPEEALAEIKISAQKEVANLDKPEEIKQKIVEGKISAYFKDRVLLSQQFVREQEITVKELIERFIQKTGEKIEISRFKRLVLLKD
ncbi:MAG TPA: translation elongation factor Ts [Candidatus Paceibacterota bacterium]